MSDERSTRETASEAATMKRGRPRIPDGLEDQAIRLRELGVSWADIERQLGISRRTVRRRTGHGNRGQNSPEGPG